MRLVSELRRRNVFRMAVLYLGAAWLFLQVVDLLINRGPLPDSLGPLALTVLVIGFPIALALSWFYEVTPEGIARNDDIQSGAILPVSSRGYDFVIIAVLAAAVVFFAYDKWWTEPPPEQSLAVLPFVAMSSGEDDGYFADGLTEEILNALAQLPELRVTARTSSFFFKNKNVPVPEIADLLKVANIVEGSVRRDGQRLRITTQLIRAADGIHLWSQTYDRAIEDILATQKDIAENVAEALGVVLDDAARAQMNAMRISDVEAFIAYQKGLELYGKAHGGMPLIEGLTFANEYFDKALAAQPDLYAARVLKSDLVGHLHEDMIAREEPDIDKVRLQAEAWKEELELAWRTSPNGNQRDIRDLERTLVSDDWTGLSALIQKAMRPGDCPTVNISERLLELGYALELARKLEESLSCSPLDAYVIAKLATAYYMAGRSDDALELLDRTEAKGINDVNFYYARVFALIAAGRFDNPVIQGFAKQAPVFQHLIQGDLAGARQLAEQFWIRPDSSITNSLVVAAMVGDRARANEFASRIDKYPSSATSLLFALRICMMEGMFGIAKGCRNGGSFDLEATPNFKARIEESGLPWPPLAFQDVSTAAM